MKNITTVFLTIFGVLMFFPFVLAYRILSWGFVISKLYAWFVLSAIPGLPDFTIMQFIGFTLFLSAMMPSSDTHLKEEYKDKGKFWISFIFNPWISLLVSYFVYTFLL